MLPPLTTVLLVPILRIKNGRGLGPKHTSQNEFPGVAPLRDTEPTRYLDSSDDLYYWHCILAVYCEILSYQCFVGRVC